jgi:hypothetical protein
MDTTLFVLIEIAIYAIAAILCIIVWNIKFQVPQEDIRRIIREQKEADRKNNQ